MAINFTLRSARRSDAAAGLDLYLVPVGRPPVIADSRSHTKLRGELTDGSASVAGTTLVDGKEVIVIKATAGSRTYVDAST